MSWKIAPKGAVLKLGSTSEIKILRMIKELIENLEKLSFDDPHSSRAEFFRREIDRLEGKLEEIRENTLIR